MASERKRPRGRPTTTPRERMRVTTWSMHVQDRSELGTSEEFEQFLNRRSKRVVLSKGQWSRHLRGDVSPQGAKVGATNSLVDRIEPLFPGTRRTFCHSVWQLLDFEVLLGPKQLQEIYLAMDSDVWQYFHFDESVCGEGTRPQDFWFWRARNSDLELGVDVLKGIKGFDGVAVGLIEARMSYLAQDPFEFVFFMKYAIHSLRNCPSTMPFLAGTKGRSILLTMEGLCVLHMVRLLTHEPQLPKEKSDDHTEDNTTKSLTVHAALMYTTWVDRCLDHFKKLSPKALKTFQIWNEEAIQFQGLFSWPELNVAD